MERIERILHAEAYVSCLEKNKACERERQFCRHDMAHFLDVARIGMLLNLQEGCGIEKELLYAAALLHDIGRWKQYEDGTPHEEAGAGLAAGILDEAGFAGEERAMILEAIAGHRSMAFKEERSLRGLLYRADKLSRACFACDSRRECNWKDDKKNLRLFL